MVRLHSKSFEIDSSHMDDGEVKIRIELTSIEAQRRDHSWMAMVPLGSVAVILGAILASAHDWVSGACFAAAAALCFVSIGQGRWRKWLRIVLAIAFALLLAIGGYFKAERGRFGRLELKQVSGMRVLPRSLPDCHMASMTTRNT
jgi:hypothetical protein